MFPTNVAVFEPVGDGIYVSTVDTDGETTTGTTGFLSGDSPEKFKYIPLFTYGAIEGSGIKTNAAFFDSQQAAAPENEGEKPKFAAVWASRHGVIVGKDGGNAQNVTEARFSMPRAARAAAVVKQAGGFVSYVVTMQDTGVEHNASLTGSLEGDSIGGIGVVPPSTPFTPTDTIEATTLETAINEVDNELRARNFYLNNKYGAV